MISNKMASAGGVEGICQLLLPYIKRKVLQTLKDINIKFFKLHSTAFSFSYYALNQDRILIFAERKGFEPSIRVTV